MKAGGRYEKKIMASDWSGRYIDCDEWCSELYFSGWATEVWICNGFIPLPSPAHLLFESPGTVGSNADTRGGKQGSTLPSVPNPTVHKKRSLVMAGDIQYNLFFYFLFLLIIPSPHCPLPPHLLCIYIRSCSPIVSESCVHIILILLYIYIYRHVFHNYFRFARLFPCVLGIEISLTCVGPGLGWFFYLNILPKLGWSGLLKNLSASFELVRINELSYKYSVWSSSTYIYTYTRFLLYDAIFFFFLFVKRKVRDDILIPQCGNSSGFREYIIVWRFTSNLDHPPPPSRNPWFYCLWYRSRPAAQCDDGIRRASRDPHKLCVAAVRINLSA